LDWDLAPAEFDHEPLPVERRDASHQILAGVIRHASQGDGKRIRLRNDGLNGDDGAYLRLVGHRFRQMRTQCPGNFRGLT